MNQSVTVSYPDPTNPEKAVLSIQVCRMGDYIVEGRSSTITMNITYEEAKKLSTELVNLKSMNGGTVRMGYSGGALHIDGALATEIYAALIEVIVDVEIGDDLAMIDVEEGIDLH